MPRPLFKKKIKVQNENRLDTRFRNEQKQKLDKRQKFRLEQILRKSRSKEYIDSITNLDSGGHTHNQEEVNRIIDGIRSEFPDLDICGILLGIVSKCYLGGTYEVHTLDMIGGIIEHFKIGQSLPGGLEIARSLANHGGYAFIEVYVDCCRAISSDGSVSVITN